MASRSTQQQQQYNQLHIPVRGSSRLAVGVPSTSASTTATGRTGGGKRSHQDSMDSLLASEFASVSLCVSGPELAAAVSVSCKRRDTVMVVSVATSTIYRWEDVDDAGRPLDACLVVLVREDGSRKAWSAPTGGHNLAWTLLDAATAYSLSPPGYEPQEVVHRASGPFATEPRSYGLATAAAASLVDWSADESSDSGDEDDTFEKSLQQAFCTFRYRAPELNDIEPLGWAVQ